MMIPIARRVCVLLLLGTLVSSQQVLSENIFIEEKSVDLSDMVIGEMAPTERTGLNYFVPVGPDSIAVKEIEIPVNKESSMVKEIAVVVVVAAFVTYIIYTLFFSSDDEEVVDDGGGKVIPALVLSGTFSP